MVTSWLIKASAKLEKSAFVLARSLVPDTNNLLLFTCSHSSNVFLSTFSKNRWEESPVPPFRLS